MASPITGTSTGVLTNQSLGNDNTPYNKGRQGELLQSPVHAQYYQQTVGGQMFSQTSTPLGLAIPLYTTTAICATGVCAMPIWNTSSNRNVVLVDTSVTYGSGTAGYGSIFLMGRGSMGYTAGTGSPFAAFASSTPKSNIVGGGSASAITSYNGATAVTLTTLGATTDVIQTLFSMNLEAQTGTAHGTLPATFYYDGGLIIPPGAAVWLASTVASVALFCVTHRWYEAPIPA